MLFSLCLRFCALTPGTELNTNANFLVMTFGFSNTGGLAIFLSLLSFHLLTYFFVSACDLSAHRYTCHHHGWLHLFLFPTNMGSPLIVRDQGVLYGPLCRTFCVSVSCYLTYYRVTSFLCGLLPVCPWRGLSFSINLTFFLVGLEILACSSHQGMYPPHTRQPAQQPPMQGRVLSYTYI